jgi:uncharacterized protein (DUF1501 family)
MSIAEIRSEGAKRGASARGGILIGCEDRDVVRSPSKAWGMSPSKLFRVSLALTAAANAVTFGFTREPADAMATILFATVTWTTGQARKGSYTVALVAAAAMLVVRAHQGIAGASAFPAVLQALPPAAAIVLGAFALRSLLRT